LHIHAGAARWDLFAEIVEPHDADPLARSQKEAVSAGDLSQRVDIKAYGECYRLRDHVNRTVEFLASFARSQHELVQRANAGDFGGRCETAGLAAFQLEMAKSLNQLVTSVESFVDEFGEVQNAVARGDLTKPISRDYPGRLEDLRPRKYACSPNVRPQRTTSRAEIQPVCAATGN
jgi:methyl-accepting chemotaxis protein